MLCEYILCFCSYYRLSEQWEMRCGFCVSLCCNEKHSVSLLWVQMGLCSCFISVLLKSVALSWRGQEFTVWVFNEMNLARGRAALRKKQSFILLLSLWGTELMYRDHPEIPVCPRLTCGALRAEAGTSHNVSCFDWFVFVWMWPLQWEPSVITFITITPNPASSQKLWFVWTCTRK